MDIDQILTWANEQASGLRAEIVWKPRDGYGHGEYWAASDPQARGRIRARAIAALAFLERFAGRDSRWVSMAKEVYGEGGDTLGDRARTIGDVIDEWASQVRSGQSKPRTIETAGAREVASTDLMGQVRVLNEDSRVEPAAAIVLAGAALEIALRATIDQFGVAVSGRLGLSSYAAALRGADVIGKQDVKDVEQMAGLRNQAAHGQHEFLSRERAGLMEQQVNIFLRRLEDLARSLD